jgi:hypothetical protein
LVEAFGADPEATAVEDEELQAGAGAVGEDEDMAAERVFGEVVADEAVEAVEAFAHIGGFGGDEDAGGGGEAEHELVGVGGGEELIEEVGVLDEVGEGGGGELEAAAVTEDDGAFGSGGGRWRLPVDLEEFGGRGMELAAVVIEGVRGDAVAGGVGGARLAAVGEVAGERE